MKEKHVFIAVALDCIEAINSYVEGYTADEFLSDRKTQDAVIRNLEVIGQALKDFGADELIALNPEIPWQQICGMRNVLAHEYMGVDPVLVWDTVQHHLEELQQALKAILSSIDNC
jgi:uncharacterized protein with HEPN domain